MVNLFDGNNSNDFHSQLYFLTINIDEDVKDPDTTIDKITNFLESNRKELITDANTLVFRALADRISVVFSADANDKVLRLIKYLRDSVEFNESLNRWLTEDDDKRHRLTACERIKEAWINQAARLDLKDLGLTKLPPCIGQLTQLKKLDLSNNKLIGLPDTIGQLIQLKELDLSNNKLIDLPDTIGQLTQLELLDLRSTQSILLQRNMQVKHNPCVGWESEGNCLKSLPETIGQLIRLKELYLCYNALEELPDTIWQLTELGVLNLKNNPLKSIPTSIGLLTQLKYLNLRKNKLKSIPISIWLLTQLKYLNLKNNKLKSIPTSIGQLTQLKYLNLQGNKLKSLPDTIGQLMQLELLSFSENKLTSLPDTIGQLIQLKDIIMTNNKLTSLPVTIGNCINIESISLNGNKELMELPISLGQISALTYLGASETGVPEQQVDDILDVCKALRAEQNTLIPHLKLWLEKGKKQIDLQKLLDQLTKEQQTILNEWLIRLEKTKDFKHCQQQLAAIVCDMLSTLLANSEFKESFFIQAEANNEACEDRAAMSLNVIYTYWKICSLPENASIAEKLEIIVRAAKTSVFRKTLSQMINEHQKKEGNAIEHEAVEIYLYYETYLREKLSLLSAIQQMTYTQIGKRDWIDENTLKDSVEISYRDELADYPAFKSLIEKDVSFNTAWESLSIQYNEKINALYDQKGLPEGELLKQSDALRREREKKWKEMALEWFEKQLSLQSRKRSSSNSTDDQQDKRRKI